MTGRNRIFDRGIIDHSGTVERWEQPLQLPQAVVVQCVQTMESDLRQRRQRIESMQLRHDSAEAAADIREEQVQATFLEGISGALNGLLNRDGNRYRWGRNFSIDELQATVDQGIRNAAEFIRQSQPDGEMPRSISNRISQMSGLWEQRLAEMADRHGRRGR